MSDFAENLKGKVAIVTGAGQGIGQRMAHGLSTAEEDSREAGRRGE